MATALSLITAALKELVVLAAGEVPSAEEATDALDTLNRVMDAWKAERVYMYSNTRVPWTITSGYGEYTLTTDSVTCVGTAVTTAVTGMRRAENVDAINISDSSIVPAYELGLRMMTDQDWAEVRIKNQQAIRPQAVYYNLTYPSATVNFWPVPTSDTLSAIIYFTDPISTLSSLNTAVSLPPGYERFMVKALAIELCPAYGKSPSPLLVEQTTEAKAVVMRSNRRLQEQRFDPGAMMRRRFYDIYSDLT